MYFESIYNVIFSFACHDGPMGMHTGRDATYNALSGNFYWRNLSKRVHNWVHCCQHCILFKSLQPSYGPMHVRLYQHPFHTLGVDYVGELPVSPNGNKWIPDLEPPKETVVENEIDSDSTTKIDKVPINTDLTRVAHEFGRYLNSLPSKSSTVSQTFN